LDRLSADASTLDTAGETNVDQWATFQDAVAGRALFQVSGGLLVFDVKDNPAAQAYFPTIGWPSGIHFDGKEIPFAAGPYGVYRFDAGEFNLLSSPRRPVNDARVSVSIAFTPGPAVRLTTRRSVSAGHSGLAAPSTRARGFRRAHNIA
jgi:hypothetical protein